MRWLEPPYNQIVDGVDEAKHSLIKFRQDLQQQKLRINTKADGSIVTQADHFVNSLLINCILENFPQDKILSEETGVINPQFASRLWIIDPLDGTSSFVDGLDDFSILVALVEAGRVTASIVCFPMLDTILLSELGTGILVKGYGGPFRVSGNVRARSRKIYIRNYDIDTELRFPERKDSGKALIEVATGQLDGALIKMTSHRSWDLAAPSLVISEAGGLVTDQDGNALVFSENPVVCDYFVASNEKCHKEILRLIK